MRKLILVVLALGIFQIAAAQSNTSLGIKGGLNVTNITSDSQTNSDNNFGLDDPSTKLSFHAGLAGDIKFAEIFGLGLEALYSRQGTKTEGNTGLAGDFSNDFKLDYITIPLLGKLYLGDSFNIHAGLQPGFIINAKQELESELLGKSTTDLTESDAIKNFDLSIPIGIGVNTNTGFFSDLRYNLGTTAVFNGENDDSDYSSKNRALQVSLGFNFN